MAKMLQSMEEMRTVAALSSTKIGLDRSGEGEGPDSVVVEGLSPQTRSPEIQRTLDWGKWPEGSGEASYGKIPVNPENDRDGGNWRQVRKLEMPIFSGENLDGWLFRTGRYFDVNGLSD